MKWLGLTLALAAVLPVYFWLRRNPRYAPWIWTTIGFLPFVLETCHLYMAAIAWSGWSGFVKGAEFSVIDALVLALYFTLPKSTRALPFRLPMILYFGTVLLSAAQSEMPEVVFFYCWQLARMFLIYMVVARACADPRVAPAILKGVAIGIIMEAGIVIWQRFALGMLQTPGNLDHQNMVGMMSLFAVFPFFALALAGRGGMFPLLVSAAALIAQVFTVSRATIGIAAFGYAILFVISALQRWTSRKALILAAGVAAVMVLAPLVMSSIERRGDLQIEDSDASRTALTDEAINIIADHPLGIGADQYVSFAQHNGYRQPTVNWGVMVHDVYLLVGAETGYLGLSAFVVFLLTPLVTAFRTGWCNRGSLAGDLLLGIGVALLTVYIQGLVEFEFLEALPQYAFAMEVGVVAGLVQQLGYKNRSRQRDSTLAFSAMHALPPGDRVVHDAGHRLSRQDDTRPDKLMPDIHAGAALTSKA